MESLAQVERLIAEVRSEHAPDPRIAVFEIKYGFEGDALTLTGETSEPAAAEALHRKVALLNGWAEVLDLVVRLPMGDRAEMTHAVVTSSIVPLLAVPLVSAGHVSQAVLGHRLMVLRREGRWLHCRAEDGYLGWVHRGYVAEMDERSARSWEIGTGGEACMSLGAEVHAEDGEVLAQLPWGARLVREHDGAGRLPNGSTGRLVGEILPLADRAARFAHQGEAVVRTAALWLGAPYVWGGVTPAGVDCSGLAQAVLGLHGVKLPRDSDQQAGVGEPVEPDPHFSNVRPGDLLFFAETPERISHVVLSEGGSGIIHSSLGNGGVRRNDLLGSLPYEQELRKLFVCARRYF